MSEKEKTRIIAVLGAYSSGKTSLVESLLHVTGEITSKGTVEAGTTAGDQALEARSLGLSTEMSVLQTSFEGRDFVFLDCPGSSEFAQHAYDALGVCDLAVVVTDPKREKIAGLSQIFFELDAKKIPHLVFVNKIDTADDDLQGFLHEMQEFSERPLVLKEMPLRENGEVVGYVDLLSEKAYRFDPEAPSKVVQMPADVRLEETDARNHMIEELTNFDDDLLEKVLDDVQPSNDELKANFVRDVREDLVVPVLFGSSLEDNGTRRLMREIYDETPDPEVTLARLGLEAHKALGATAFKTRYLPHIGKSSYLRVWNQPLCSGARLGSLNVSNLNVVRGKEFRSANEVAPFGVAVLLKTDDIATGDVLTQDGVEKHKPAALTPLYGLSLTAKKRSDEIKVATSINKLVEQDRSLARVQSSDTGELVLWGQGERHLEAALLELKNKYNLEIDSAAPSIPYRETIESSTETAGRHRKQSGGHGQFGDVRLEIQPAQRGEGFRFGEKISGGVVPKNYFSAVEDGVKDYMRSGELGFQVEDIEVTLVDGSYHKVDSSDQAFKMAAIVGMKQGMPACSPLLLEPILSVNIHVPAEDLAAAQRLITGHRGAIQGFEESEDLRKWVKIQSQVPQAEMQKFITELRSLTHGLGYFETEFGHMQELRGRLADQVVERRAQEARTATH